jgi:hypothetical protein
MSIKIDDCPPSLKAAILKQLEKDNVGKTTNQTLWAVASRASGRWKCGPGTINMKLVQRLVKQLQLQTPLAAYETSKGNPPAVVIEYTVTTAVDSSTF